MDKDAETLPVEPTDDLSFFFWDRCAQHELWIQHCPACDSWQYYPRHICSHCHSLDVVWRRPSGAGVVETFSVVTRATGAFREYAPYVIAVVRLAEGPTMLTQLVNLDERGPEVGLAVQVTFERRAGRILPLFRLA